MFQITLDGIVRDVSPGDTYQSIIDRQGAGKRALAVRVGGDILPLTRAPRAGEAARTTTYLDPEGVLVYERSLRFVFLLAVKQLYPEMKVRIEHSVGNGIYSELQGDSPLNVEVVRSIEARMQELVESDLPFEYCELSRREVIEYFEQQGATDKVRLLKYRPYERFQLYQCAQLREYFYGAMVPSTGYVGVFALKLYLPGVVLLLPDPKDPQAVSPLRDMPKLMQTFARSARWNAILECKNAADLNEMTVKGQLREFIRVNEALHEKSISAIADQYAGSGARLILIAGPSSSGKTTFTHRLSIALKVLGLRPMLLSLDNYYRNRKDIAVNEDGEVDLEKLDTLDVPLFNEQLVRIMQGERVNTPTFHFPTGMRSDKTIAVEVKADQPILVEGIHGLNDELTRDIARAAKFKIYVSALTTLNLDDHNRIRTTDARLLRRIVRDHQFRGTKPEDTMAMWPMVRRGEENYIFPYQEEADVMFDTSLAYEMAILKRYVYPALAEIKPDSPHYTMARRLVKFLNYFRSSDVEDEVPLNSILREFIGGCCFYRNDD